MTSSDADLCGCDRPDLTEDPHRHDRDPACTFWAGIRDEVRALAAAHDTDGLGLPQVEVREVPGGLAAFIGTRSVMRLYDSETVQPARDLAAAASALLRARLADEATTDDKETDR